jgi:hypothetical protein
MCSDNSLRFGSKDVRRVGAVQAVQRPSISLVSSRSIVEVYTSTATIIVENVRVIVLAVLVIPQVRFLANGNMLDRVGYFL